MARQSKEFDRLVKLRENGFLSESEFEHLKKQLIAVDTKEQELAASPPNAPALHPERTNNSLTKSVKHLGILFVIIGLGLASFKYYKTNTLKLPPVPSIGTSRYTPGDPIGKGYCILGIDSDPREAAIMVNGESKGVTPNSISVRCSEPSTIELKLDGYQLVRRSIALNKNENFYETMTPIPMGTLKLTLSHNASVFVNSSKKADATAGEPFVLRLPAGQQYNVYFENRPLGIDYRKNYSIRQNDEIMERINLKERN